MSTVGRIGVDVGGTFTDVVLGDTDGRVVTCKVATKSPGEVPRSQGKAVRVRDQRNKAN